jgi:hypothetical protein
MENNNINIEQEQVEPVFETEIVKAKQELNEVIKVDFFTEISQRISVKKKDAETVLVTKDDSKLYRGAKSQMTDMRLIKKSIMDFKKKAKAKIKELGQHIDATCNDNLNDINDAIEVLRIKMSVYEQEQDRLKQEKRAKEAEERQKTQELERKMREMADKFEEIEKCETEAQVDAIQKWISEIDYDSFGDKKEQALFQRTQIEMMCKMQRKVIAAQVLAKQNTSTEPTPIDKTCPVPVFAPPKKEVQKERGSNVTPEILEEKEMSVAELLDTITTESTNDTLLPPIEDSQADVEQDVSDVENYVPDTFHTENIVAEKELDEELSNIGINVPLPSETSSTSSEPMVEKDENIPIDEETIEVLSSVTVYHELKKDGDMVIGFAGINCEDSLFSDAVEINLIVFENGNQVTRKFVCHE